MQKYVFLFLCCAFSSLKAQVVGGQQTFEFLRLPQSPHITALGGTAICNPSSDIMMISGNPALLRPEFHTNLGLNYNMYYAGTKVTNLEYAHHSKKINTTFGLGLQHMNYGTFRLADDIGTVTGESKAVDYSINLSASKSYLEKWRYGTTLKMAHSFLIDKKSSALLADIGLMYADTNSQWYVGAAIKNAGVVIKKYDKDFNQYLPLDLQIGITKKFKKAPFSINILAHHLQTWDIRYNNPNDVNNTQLLFTDSSTTTKTKTYFADKLFRHFVFAVELNLGKRIEVSAGYNHLRRAELALSDKKGMAGFSYGLGVYLGKFTLHAAQSYYHLAGAYTEIGLNFKLNQFIGFGSGGKINWSEKFSKSYK